MYARLSGTGRYQALKELAQQARSVINPGAAGDYKTFVRDLVKQADETHSFHRIQVPLPQGMLVCFSVGLRVPRDDGEMERLILNRTFTKGGKRRRKRAYPFESPVEIRVMFSPVVVAVPTFSCS